MAKNLRWVQAFLRRKVSNHRFRQWDMWSGPNRRPEEKSSDIGEDSFGGLWDTREGSSPGALWGNWGDLSPGGMWDILVGLFPDEMSMEEWSRRCFH